MPCRRCARPQWSNACPAPAAANRLPCRRSQVAQLQPPGSYRIPPAPGRRGRHRACTPASHASWPTQCPRPRRARARASACASTRRLHARRQGNRAHRHPTRGGTGSGLYRARHARRRRHRPRPAIPVRRATSAGGSSARKLAGRRKGIYRPPCAPRECRLRLQESRSRPLQSRLKRRTARASSSYATRGTWSYCARGPSRRSTGATCPAQGPWRTRRRAPSGRTAKRPAQAWQGTWPWPSRSSSRLGP